MARMRPVPAIIASATGMFAVMVHAQSSDALLQRLDNHLGRADREPATPSRFGLLAAEEKAQPFKFELGLPATWNSNIQYVDGGTTDSLHFDPGAKLSWSSVSGRWQPFAFIAADSDFYPDHRDVDGASLVARIGVNIKDERLGRIVPYAHYTASALYGHAFADHQVTVHDFAVGSRAVFGEADPVTLDFKVLRREATSHIVEQSRIGGSVTLDHEIRGGLSLSFMQALEYRHFTGGANRGRDDFYTRSGLTLDWEFRPGQADLSAGLVFEHNASDATGKDFSTFDLGPSLGLTWKF